MRWLFPTGHPVQSSPAVAGNTVYVGSGPTLYAIGADDGTPRWSFPTGGLITDSPAVVGGSVYVGSHEGYLYAIGGNDGTTPLPGPASSG